jgi:hypothetical protein
VAVPCESDCVSYTTQLGAVTYPDWSGTRTVKKKLFPLKIHLSFPPFWRAAGWHAGPLEFDRQSPSLPFPKLDASSVVRASSHFLGQVIIVQLVVWELPLYARVRENHIWPEVWIDHAEEAFSDCFHSHHTLGELSESPVRIWASIYICYSFVFPRWRSHLFFFSLSPFES